MSDPSVTIDVWFQKNKLPEIQKSLGSYVHLLYTVYAGLPCLLNADNIKMLRFVMQAFFFLFKMCVIPMPSSRLFSQT